MIALREGLGDGKEANPKREDGGVIPGHGGLTAEIGEFVLVVTEFV